MQHSIPSQMVDIGSYVRTAMRRLGSVDSKESIKYDTRLDRVGVDAAQVVRVLPHRYIQQLHSQSRPSLSLSGPSMTHNTLI